MAARRQQKRFLDKLSLDSIAAEYQAEERVESEAKKARRSLWHILWYLGGVPPVLGEAAAYIGKCPRCDGWE